MQPNSVRSIKAITWRSSEHDIPKRGLDSDESLRLDDVFPEYKSESQEDSLGVVYVPLESIDILGNLGRGAFASVDCVRVLDGPLGSPDTTYAMKSLVSRGKQQKSVNDNILCSRDNIGMIDLVNEAKILSSLSHTNIITLCGLSGCFLKSHNKPQVQDCVNVQQSPFLILEALDQTLDKYLAHCQGNDTNLLMKIRSNTRTKSEPLYERLKLCMKGIIQGMIYLHQRGIVHLDLKPGNIGFLADGTVKIFDFGFAKHVSSSIVCEEAGIVMGTPRYMAPERFKNEDMTFFSDVYSFGILLWEICALKKPFGKGICFEALRTKVVDTNSRPCLKNFSSKILKDLLTRCWDPNPSKRPTFESIDEILENLLVEVKALKESGSNPGIRLSHSFSSRYESMIFDFSKADLSMNPNGSDSTDLNMSSRELRRSSFSTTR